MKSAIIYLRVSTLGQAKKDEGQEGFSLPAQRQACYRKADGLDADVVEEYVDQGESAKTADRPALQRLLARLHQDHDLDYVIVHKLDRLARNRYDDVVINLAIQQAGAQLISVSENIDETPSGKLLHGIMASIGEFYRLNLASEVVKGTTEKVRRGGTPTKAPIGYLNVRQLLDGHEVRTVVLDPERSALVRLAFEAYVSGEWTLRGLLDELTEQGSDLRE